MGESGDLCLHHCVPISLGPSSPSRLSRGNITHRLGCNVLLLLSVAKILQRPFRKPYSEILPTQLLYTGQGCKGVCKTPPPTPASLNP